MKLFKELYVLELILFSGGVVFNGTYPRSCLIIWVLTTALLLIKEKPNKNNILICIGISLWILLVQFVFVRGSFDNKYVSYLLYMAGGLGLFSFTLAEFRSKMLKWMKIIAFFSIIAQIGYDILSFPSYTHYDDGGSSFTICMLFFNVAWASGDTILHRLSSVFWEPGQYQILITFTLCLFIDEIADFKNFKIWFKKFGVLIVAMLLTQSTMGYLVLMLIIAISFIFSRKRTSKKQPSLKKHIVSLFTFCIIAVGIFFMWNSSVIQDKLAQGDSNYDNSYNIRMADNFACLIAALESPIYGQGIETAQLQSRLSALGNFTASNGWLLSAASLGFVYVAIILVIMYMRINEMQQNVPTLAVLGVLFLAQCNESVMYFPYLYIYVYHFKKKKGL